MKSESLFVEKKPFFAQKLILFSKIAHLFFSVMTLNYVPVVDNLSEKCKN